MLNTPVLLLIYNRPDLGRRVFDEIKKAAPKKLFIAADGPDDSKESDYNKCASARDISRRVDWDCQVYTLFREANLGCEKAVSSAINWFFDNVEDGVILEDDIIPSVSFFLFCEQMLKYYRNDPRLMTVSGSYFGPRLRRYPYSYSFSRYSFIGGWATWRRAWQYYDNNMESWPKLKKDNWLGTIFNDTRTVNYWATIFDNSYLGRNNSWAYKWMFSSWARAGFTAIPRVNLLNNIGYGIQATHTKLKKGRYTKLYAEELIFPLRHPPVIRLDLKVDKYMQRKYFFYDPVWFVKVVKDIARRILKMARK